MFKKSIKEKTESIIHGRGHRDDLRSIFFVFALFCSLAAAFGNPVNDCNELIEKGRIAKQEKNHSEALKYFTEAKELALNNNLQNELFLAVNYLGIVYNEMFDYGEALNNYLEAYTIVLNNKFTDYEYMVLNNIAILYSKEHEYDNARIYFEKAYNMTKSIYQKDKTEENARVHGIMCTNLGIICNESGLLDDAMEYFNESMVFLKNDSIPLLDTKYNLLDNQLRRKNYQAVIDEVPKLLKEEESLQSTKNTHNLYYLLGEAYYATGQISQSLHFSKKALEGNNDLESQYKIYDLISKITFAKNDLMSTIHYKDMMAHVKDSLHDKKDGKLYENSKIKFELLNYKHELALKQAQLKNERNIFIELLAVFILLIIFLIVYFRNRNIKLKQKNELALQNKKIIELELEKEKNEKLLLEKQIKGREIYAELEKERLKSEIELRNRQLSSKALYLSSRDQMMNEFIEYISKHPDLQKDNLLQQHIASLKNKLNTKNEWDSFFNHFEEINQGLLSNLKIKYPELNTNDLRFISYVYMKLSSKEIATLLNITTEAFRKRKERISAKIGLDKEQNLFDFLFTFQNENQRIQ